MIKIICLGKIKEKYLEDLINDYSKRIKKYHKLEIIELKDENDLVKEKNNIIKYIGKTDYNIVLDIKGRKVNSVEFSDVIDKAFITAGTINFIIGSSEGLDQEILDKANIRISFSDLTFPHGMFRGILLEQIYRSFKILNNESYHK